MAISKVIFGSRTLIDLSSSTVTPETLGEGVKAFNAKGELIIGTMKAQPSTVSVRLNGAPGEVITYSGGALGDVTLNSSGTATVDIPKGNYTFASGISGYSKSATVSSNQIIDVFPAGAIYWYGREIYSFSAAQQQAGVGLLTKNANYMRFFYNGASNSTQRAAAILTDSILDLTGYTSLNFVTQTETQGSNCYSGVFNTRAVTYSTFQNSSCFAAKSSLLNYAGKSEYSVNISSVNSGFVGTGIAEYNKNDRYVQIHAIWME